MTALDRARGWFIAPPEGTGDEPAWCADPSTEQGRVIRSFRLPEAEKHTSPADPNEVTTSALRPAAAPKPRLNGWQPPTPPDDAAPECPGGAHPDEPTGSRPARRDGPGVAPPGSSGAVPDQAAGSRPDTPAPPPGARSAAPNVSHGTRHTDPSPTRAETIDLSTGGAGSAIDTATREVTSAAVLGRPGEVEPVAAALALALRRDSRAATATVAVVGAALPELTEGGGAARKLGARLAAHGFEARVRGRLAWVRLDPGDGQLAKTARRLTLIGAPAVLAVTAPRNADTDRALLDCDLLVIVAADPEGPLAGLAAAGLAGVPVTTVRPLGRGPARALARAGIRSTSAIRSLLSTDLEVQP